MSNNICSIGKAKFSGYCDDCVSDDPTATQNRQLFAVSGIGNTRPGGWVYLCNMHFTQFLGEAPLLGLELEWRER